MPAEWEPHAATWLAWPHEASDWPGKIAPIPWVYTDIVRHLHRREHVHILVNDGEQGSRRRTLPHEGGRGPQRSHVPSLADRPRLDARLRADLPRRPARREGPSRLALQRLGQVRQLEERRSRSRPSRQGDGLPVWQPIVTASAVVLEGGSIEVNGRGLLLTTEECLLSEIQCRNPGHEHARITRRCFAEYLGVQKVLWLNRGIAGDDTHGHVDDLARFVAPRTDRHCRRIEPERGQLRAAAGEPGTLARHDRPRRPKLEM